VGKIAINPLYVKAMSREPFNQILMHQPTPHQVYTNVVKEKKGGVKIVEKYMVQSLQEQKTTSQAFFSKSLF
jgi:hypothetical protein